MFKTLPWHTKIVIALLAFLPLYFAISALGTKIGIWSWQTGLMALTFGGGTILLGIVALAAVVSLILAVRAKPRSNGLLAIAIIGLLAPAAAFVVFLSAGSKAGENPIHDIATDTANPPMFSAETMAAREAAGANPLSNYQTPLGQLELYEDVGPELAVRSHAQIITDRKDRPAPLPLGGADTPDGVAAVMAAMGAMGLTDIKATGDAQGGMVEGVATSFWFGFKDDVVARVGQQQIDFRSVSRVGRSDLGANTARIIELRQRTETQLGSASRRTPPAP